MKYFKTLNESIITANANHHYYNIDAADDYLIDTDKTNIKDEIIKQYGKKSIFENCYVYENTYLLSFIHDLKGKYFCMSDNIIRILSFIYKIKLINKKAR